jgi:hypothetical protein
MPKHGPAMPPTQSGAGYVPVQQMLLQSPRGVDESTGFDKDSADRVQSVYAGAPNPAQDKPAVTSKTDRCMAKQAW